MKVRQKRRIIVLSDGTGNSAGKLFRTNVWRLYQAIEVADGSQITRYDDGVGTSSFKPLAILGGAIGWGLKRNIINLYMFIARNYEPGDDIYAFGFSRGAFTVRVLIKFILSEGIVDKYYSEDDLRWKANQLYRRFRTRRKTRFGLATLGRAIRDMIIWVLAKFFRGTDDAVTSKIPDAIKFIGVWDTVDAYGLPVYELKKGIDKYIWPLALEDRELDARIKKARHAICIDDQRKTFHPLLWDESTTAEPASVQESASERLLQVFFVGVHANLGGGYPDDNLSYVPLNWMMKEAAKAGLRFDTAAIAQLAANANPFGTLYDSRRGLAAYYRYEPRHLVPPRDHQGAVIPYPKVHESVLVRMAFGTDAYAPLAFPYDSHIVIEPSWDQVLAGLSPKYDIVSVCEYPKLKKPAGPYAKLCGVNAGDQVLSNLSRPDVHSIELIWDTVWWRRIAYFATVFASLALLASPLFTVSLVIALVAVAFNLENLGNAINVVSPPIVELAAKAMSAVAPHALSPWIDAFRNDPANFLTLALLIAGCLLWGGLVDRRIRDRSSSVWNINWREQRGVWYEVSLLRRYKASLVTAITSSALLLWIVIQYLFNKRDCEGDLGCGIFEYIRENGRYVAGGILSLICITSTYWFYVLRKAVRSRVQGEVRANSIEPRGMGLTIANRIRTSITIVRVFNYFENKVVPAAFAIALIFVSAALINHGVFNFLSALGSICAGTPELIEVEEEEKIALLTFNSGCQATGLQLNDREKYIARIAYDLGDVPDKAEPDETKALRDELSKYPRNSPLPSYNWFVNFIATPFRRSFSDGWFRPLLLIGDKEYKDIPVGGELLQFVEFTPERSGEVFLYLNNVVVGWPSLFDIFYTQKGSIKIGLKRVSKQSGSGAKQER